MAGNFQSFGIAELQVLQDHNANLTTVIATNITLLGPQLVQYGFAVHARVSGIVNLMGITDDQKAGQLLDLVYAKITAATTKENARKDFNNFLMIIAHPLGHRDIAKSLAAALKSKDPSYASPLQPRATSADSKDSSYTSLLQEDQISSARNMPGVVHLVPGASTSFSEMSPHPSSHCTIQDIKSNLKTTFSRVQIRLINSNGVTVQSLRRCVAVLPSFQSDNPEPLLTAENVELFIHALKKYCSPLNPEILEDLVDALGDEETKGKLSDFRRVYISLQQMKLRYLIGNVEDSECMPPGYKELELKLGDDWHNKTLADLKKLKEQMSVKHWILKLIDDGSITVTYLVPKSETLLLGDYCQSQNVLQITMEGKIVFQFEVSMTPRSSQIGQLRGSDSHSRSQHPARNNADLNREIVDKHLGQIADGMYEWRGKIAEELGLGQADVAAIMTSHPTNLRLQTRAALSQWKQKNGSKSTYIKLIKVFEYAGYQQYADNVRKLASEKTGAEGHETHADPDSEDIETAQDLRWCDIPLLEQSSGQGNSQMSLASLRQSNLWDADQLNVTFLNNIPTKWAFCAGGMNVDSIMNLAQLWNKKGKHIPRLKLVKYGAPADIRVSFTENKPSQSYVGVRAQDEHHDKPTMWLNLSTGGDEYKKHLVVHEFGHALGLDHEHQRGDFWKLIKPYVKQSAMKTDLKGVYESYTADLAFGASDRKITKYDPNSVMHYWFKSCWLKEGYNSEKKVKNAELSPDTEAALLGILQRSKGTLVTKPSQQDLDFLDERYKEKKESKKNDTDNGKGLHTDVEEGPAHVQLPHTELEETPKPSPMKGPVQPSHAEVEPPKPTPVEGSKQSPHAKEETPKPTPAEGPPQPQPVKVEPVQQPPADQGAAPHTEKNPQWIKILLFISNICCQGIEQLGAKTILIALMFVVCAYLMYYR